MECGGISRELFSILANPAKYGAGVSWNCDSCQASAARLEERMNALEGRFQEVENRVVRSEGIVQDATRRVDSVEQRQTRLEGEVARERERAKKERAEEMREREMRRKNVVMHRVGEAVEETASFEERKKWDLLSCNNIFAALQLDMRAEAVVKFCRRVGEKGEGPRPLLVGFKRESQKEDLLEKARDLRNTQFAEVTIIPDLTNEQRKEEAEMVKEAEQRNRQLTQEDLAKNLEWRVVGARGEKRLIKTVQRSAPRGGMRGVAAVGGVARGVARGAVRGATRGAARGAMGGQVARSAAAGPPAAGPATLGPELLEPRQRASTWNPVVGRAGRKRGRPSNKRRRGEVEDEEDESESETMAEEEEAEVFTQQQVEEEMN
jgi:hypothetical protein